MRSNAGLLTDFVVDLNGMQGADWMAAEWPSAVGRSRGDGFRERRPVAATLDQ